MDKLFEKIHALCARFIKNEKLMDVIRKLVSREVFFYLFFGVMTTVVNLLTLAVFNRFVDIMISNIIAWVAAVVFAYITNKLFVFESKSWKPDILIKEVASFSGARLVTLGIEELGLFVMINLLHLEKVLAIPSLFSGEIVIKGILAVVVVVLNYIFSKLIIFRKKYKSFQDKKLYRK